MILENTSTGAAASTDFIVSSNSGTSSTYYGDFGINGSGFVGTGSLSIPNATYLYSQNGDLAIGTASSNAIHFVVNSGTTDAMTISSSGTITANNLVNLAGNSTSLAATLPNIGEVVTVNASSPTSAVAFNIATQSIIYYTAVPVATFGFALSFFGSGSGTGTSVNSMMSIGQSVSVALFVTNGGYYTYPLSFYIDAVQVTAKWANGIPITSGNLNATDIYNFTIIKTASATYTVLASQVKYA
jgi:hypothetical protein